MSAKMKEIFKETYRQFTLLEHWAARTWDKHTTGISITLLLFLLLIALFWNRIFISIDSGQQGIRWSRIHGTQLDEQYDEGLHIIWPWDRMYIYSTRIQTRGDTMQILTAEGLSINIAFVYRFYVIPDSIPVIHQNLGVNYAETYVTPEVQSASMSIIGNYTPEELYKVSSLVIQSTIMYYLNKQLIARNIIIEDYLIKRISLPEIVSRSIEKKMVAEQLSYEFDYKLLTEEKERRRKLIEAEGIRAFEEVSQIPILKWKGLEVTSEFARSSNSKIIIMGTNEKDLPLLLNTEK
jgi:regulator of protease activity HflC (stomatin/prohibitin superfamily)